jgi:transcriptional antiterminator NusG
VDKVAEFFLANPTCHARYEKADDARVSNDRKDHRTWHCSYRHDRLHPPNCETNTIPIKDDTMSDENVKEEAPVEETETPESTEKNAPEETPEPTAIDPNEKPVEEALTEEIPEPDAEEVEAPILEADPEPVKEDVPTPEIPTVETMAPEPYSSINEPEDAPPIPNIATSTAEGKTDPFAQEKKAPEMPVINTGIEAAKQALPTIKGAQEVLEEEDDEPVETVKEEKKLEQTTHIYALRTTANREDQVMGFLASNAARKKLGVFSVIAPHGMRGYIFVEALDRHEAEQAAFGVPYAKGLLPNEIQYSEIEHMLEQVKKDINIQKNDIAEILSGPFKREKAKIARVDKAKEEVVVELLEAAVPIPITLKIDAVKVIRRDEK